MIYGISGSPILIAAPYVDAVSSGCGSRFAPCVTYAIATRETIRGEVAGLWIAASVIGRSVPHGYGLLQATDPDYRAVLGDAWSDPQRNVAVGVDVLLVPTMQYWHNVQGLSGDDLVRAILAEWNAGRSQALAGHAQGDVGLYCAVDESYGRYDTDCLEQYHLLSSGQRPQGV